MSTIWVPLFAPPPFYLLEAYFFLREVRDLDRDRERVRLLLWRDSLRSWCSTDVCTGGSSGGLAYKCQGHFIQQACFTVSTLAGLTHYQRFCRQVFCNQFRGRAERDGLDNVCEDRLSSPHSVRIDEVRDHLTNLFPLWWRQLLNVEPG